jgi:hypothetical protein
MTTKIVPEKHLSCVVDPTTYNADKCLNVKKKRSYTVRDLHK